MMWYITFTTMKYWLQADDVRSCYTCVNILATVKAIYMF